jgi:hypothetical protein
MSAKDVGRLSTALTAGQHETVTVRLDAQGKTGSSGSVIR